MPFALVAVLLLMSSSMCVLFAARLARDEGDMRIREARLEALARVGENIHHEVVAQAQVVALDAIARGIDGVVNETRMASAFRERFENYLAEHFPRVLRGIAVHVLDTRVSIRLLDRQMEDLVPSDRSARERVGDMEVEVPDESAPDTWGVVSRFAYYEVRGRINYSLEFGDTMLLWGAPVEEILPAPAPLMEAKLEQAVRRGAGDLVGVGHTVKAIVASLVQYRLMDGYASYTQPGTTLMDVLTTEDISLAVNFAIILEEARLFREFDRDAASALDAAIESLPEIPQGFEPSAGERTLARLVERYATGETLDAVDLFALWRGMDVTGVSMESIFAQAIAAVQDQFALKFLDYLGLTPLADFLSSLTEGLAYAWDQFTSWIGGEPERDVRQMHQYVREVFRHGGRDTLFASPLVFPVPERSYTVSNGSADVQITIPRHFAAVGFIERDLLSRVYDEFWKGYYRQFLPHLKAIHDGLRDVANDMASRVARDAVDSGLLPRRVSIPIDPNDNASFLSDLGIQVAALVDQAISEMRSNPGRILDLTRGLWVSYASLLRAMIDRLISSYDLLAVFPAFDQVGSARAAIRQDLAERARGASDYDALGALGQRNLADAIADDVQDTGLAEAAWEARRDADVTSWRHVADVLTGADLPGDPAILRQLIDAVVGASGWFAMARGTLLQFLEEVARAQSVAGLRAVYAVRLGGFELWEANSTNVRTERFQVRHTPRVLQAEDPIVWNPAMLQVGSLWVQILDPSVWPPSAENSPNVHYTKVGDTSYRPFTTGWTLRILGALHVELATEDRPLIGSEGPVPVVVGRVWPLEFSFATQAYSGWGLAGVQYRASSTFLGDLWDAILGFLEWVWDSLVSIAKWVLDLLGQAVRFVMDLLEPIFSFAEEVVGILGDLLGRLADLLHDLLVTAVNLVGGIVDAIASLFPEETEFRLSFFGFGFAIQVNGDEGTVVGVLVEAPMFEVAFRLLDLEERFGHPIDGLRYDITLEWDVSVGPFALEASFDPFAAVLPDIATGSMSWRGSWAIDFHGFSVEYTVQARLSAAFSVITPLGPADVEVGFFASFRADPGSFWEAVDRSLREALDEFGEDLPWGRLGGFAQSFARRLVANWAGTVEQLAEAGLFVEVTWRPGVVAGAGFRLSFVADGQAVTDVLRWVVENVLTFFERFLDPLAPARYHGLSPHIAEHLFVRFEGFLVLGLPRVIRTLSLPAEVRGTLAAMIEANVAAFGALFGENWGRWEFRFALYADVTLPLRDVAFGSLDQTWTVWLLEGSLHGY